MRRSMLVLFAFTLVVGAFAQKQTKKTKAPVETADQKAAIAVAHQFVDGVIKNDLNSAVATCADNAAIIDEFPPFHWQGCQEWANAYAAAVKQYVMTEVKVTLGKPLHADVSTDRAYIVMPAAFSYKTKGERVSEPNSRMTFALQKQGESWKIVAWTWSKG